MQNAILEFARLVKAEEQVVAGTLHHLTVEAIDTGKKKLYEAKVWVKPWLNFKELQEFKHVGDSSCTSADLGAKQGNDSKTRVYGLPMIPLIRILGLICFQRLHACRILMFEHFIFIGLYIAFFLRTLEDDTHKNILEYDIFS